MGTKVAELKMSIKEFFNEKVNSRNVENPNSNDGELAESLSQSNQHEEELIGDTFRSKVGQILENDNAKFALAATGVVTAIALALITRGKVKNKKMYNVQEQVIKDVRAKLQEADDLAKNRLVAWNEKSAKVKNLNEVTDDFISGNRYKELKALKDRKYELENAIKRARENADDIERSGPYKGSNGYSPDGDHVYGDYPAESIEHFEWRLSKAKREVELLQKEQNDILAKIDKAYSANKGDLELLKRLSVECNSDYEALTREVSAIAKEAKAINPAIYNRLQKEYPNVMLYANVFS